MSRIDTALRRARSARAAASARGLAVDNAADWQDLTPAYESSSGDLHALRSERGDGEAPGNHVEPSIPSRPLCWPVAQKADPPAVEARPQPATRPVTQPVSHNSVSGVDSAERDATIAGENPGWAPSEARAPLDAGRMFEALDRVLAQAPLASPRRVTPSRRGAAE